MGLCNELSCEVGSFSGHLSPCSFFHSEVLRLYFPTLEPWVAGFVLFPSCSSWLAVCKCGTAHSASCHFASSLDLHFAHPGLLDAVSPGILPPTSLNECFFFNSLVIRLPYSLIFWQFWLFFVFKFVVVLLVVRGGKVYLPTFPLWPFSNIFLIHLILVLVLALALESAIFHGAFQ